MITINEFFQSTIFNIEFYKTNFLNLIGIGISIYIAKKSHSLKNELIAYKKNLIFKDKLNKLIVDLQKYIDNLPEAKSSIDISREISSLSIYKKEFKYDKDIYKPSCKLFDYFTEISKQTILDENITLFRTNIYKITEIFEHKKGVL